MRKKESYMSPDETDDATRVLEILSAEPTDQEVQCCCLAYGESSFNGPMRAALKTHLQLLRQKNYIDGN